jgi:ATP-binding cassette subfamily G (WHITE) protein 2 (PDR)
MINEFAGRTFECDTIVPSGPGYPANAANAACSVVGSQPGSLAVPGTNYLIESYGYFPSHRWRNIGTESITSLAEKVIIDIPI